MTDPWVLSASPFPTILCVSLNEAIRTCRSIYTLFQTGHAFCKHSNVKPLATLATLLFWVFYAAFSAQTIIDLVLNQTEMMTLNSIPQLAQLSR